jgi:hypothetical protein
MASVIVFRHYPHLSLRIAHTVPQVKLKADRLKKVVLKPDAIKLSAHNQKERSIEKIPCSFFCNN